jgi:TolB-like protein/DNA-binding winged helix-turn-helix (wHTH) protein/Tfp pilus assembly protein PilF
MAAGTGRAQSRYRFGRCELDVSSGELRRDGVTTQLHGQPLQVLLLLIERAGDIVTREEIQRRVWKDETFVDFERGLNSIIKRLREALGDSAEHPLLIQTVPRRGYRFLVAPQALLVTDSVDANSPDPEGARAFQASVVANRAATRWLFAAALVAALAAIAYAVVRRADRPVAPGARSLRLAVLPFENLTGRQDQQFFADGLHEELIVRLGRVQPRQLTVIARTSVMRYREAPKDVVAIGRELGVDFVLEGSVRQAGDRIRVTAQLIRATDQLHLWTETYDRSWNDVFAIQADVGARVADSLAVELLPASQAIAASGTVRPKAYEHYLRGRFYWNQRTRDPSAQLAHAIEEFEAAIAEQPDYALAYAGLADSYDSIFFANPAVGDTPYARARDALRRALQLDPRLAPAYSTLGWMTLHFDRNLREAESAFDRALELDPTDSLARFRRAHVLAIRGRLRDAEAEAEDARRSDPLSAPIADILGWLAYYRGDNAAALQRMEEASELEGSPTKVHVFRAYLHAQAGDCGRAAAELRPWTADPETLRLGESVYARARCDDGAAVADLEQTLLARRLTYSTAMFHFARREMDAFYEWLDRAIDERFPEPLYLAADPVFNAERADRRFQAALRRVGL